MRLVHSLAIAMTGLAASAIVLAESHSTPEPSGQAIFEAHCANCHTGGIGGFFSKAPDIDDPKDWATAVPKGVDGLTATTLAGIGKMAPRGDCTTCTDAEIRAAVEYMLEKIQ